MNRADFQNLGEGVIRSSKGFQVQSAPSWKLVYREGDRKMVFGSEPGIHRWFFYLQKMKWEPPHDAEPISEADQERIIWNIADALKFQGTAFCLETSRGNVYESTYRDE